MATRVRSAIPAADPSPIRRARSPQAKDVVRQALIDAGRELLLARPETPVSLRGIARRAGYSSGVIYRYFADRDALFLAIRDSEMAQFVDGLEADFPLDDDPETGLLRMADRAFDYSRHQIATFGLDSLFLFWLDKSDVRGGGRGVHDDAPAAARIHAFFERSITALLPARMNATVDLGIAVAGLMAAISGSVLLPASSDHRDFPDGRAVMHATIAALIAHWRS